MFKACYNRGKVCSTLDRKIENNLLPINQLRDYQCALFTRKLMDGLILAFHVLNGVGSTSQHHIIERSDSKYCKDKVYSKTTENSVLTKGPILLNILICNFPAFELKNKRVLQMNINLFPWINKGKAQARLLMAAYDGWISRFISSVNFSWYTFYNTHIFSTTVVLYIYI